MRRITVRLENQTIYDVIGIGFGPSNLSMAIALDEVIDENKKLNVTRVD